jgi:hypothetical protein
VVPAAAEDSTRHASAPLARCGPVQDRLLRCGRHPQEVPAIDLDAVIGPYLASIVAALALVVAVLIVLLLIVLRRVATLDRRLAGLTRGGEGRSLEAVLDAHLDRVDGVARDLDDVVARTVVLEAASRKALSRVGLVRYNPFEETGGNQSFALALLDARGDGLVLSSLHARSGTRVYAKAIAAGRSDAALSDEETAAIRQATA